MDRSQILIQLDSDPQPSVFDAVVAVDAGVAQLLRHGGVTPEAVRELVHGAIFTRGPEELKHTAVFIGGSNVRDGEKLLKAVTASFFGPLRVSVLIDSNGANTTSAAAVLAAAREIKLSTAKALVLAATGPVGARVVRLLAREGAEVIVASRSIERARATCTEVSALVSGARIAPCEVGDDAQAAAAVKGVQIVVAAGAAGIQLMSKEALAAADSLRVVIDLNAVPPLGISGVESADYGKNRDSVICYGALGIGGTKMKIHKTAVRRLFASNSQVLDAEEIYKIGQELGV